MNIYHLCLDIQTNVIKRKGITGSCNTTNNYVSFNLPGVMLSSANEGSFLSFLAKCRTFSAYSGSHISHNFGEASPCITRKSCAI